MTLQGSNLNNRGLRRELSRTVQRSGTRGKNWNRNKAHPVINFETVMLYAPHGKCLHLK